MNRSKAVKLIIITAVISVIAIIVAVLTMVFGYKDGIVNSEERRIDNTELIYLKMSSGEEISVPVTLKYEKVGTNEYQFEIFCSENGGSEKYNVENLRLDLKISDEYTVENVNCERDKENSFIEHPQKDGKEISSENGMKLLSYETEGDYMRLTVLAKGDEPQKAVVNVQFDITGSGMYRLNSFKNISHQIGLMCEV